MHVLYRLVVFVKHLKWQPKLRVNVSASNYLKYIIDPIIQSGNEHMLYYVLGLVKIIDCLI